MPDRSARRQATEQPHLDALSALAPTAPTPNRVKGLIDIGIEAEELAEALDVSPTTIRNWVNHEATPRRMAVRVVDDLRRVVLVLAEGGITDTAAGQWLRSRQGGVLENDRPLEIISTDPMRVLAAAHEFVLEQEELRTGGLHAVPN